MHYRHISEGGEGTLLLASMAKRDIVYKSNPSLESILCSKTRERERGKKKRNRRKRLCAFVSGREEMQHISNWLILQIGLVGGNHIMLLVGGWVGQGGRRRRKRARIVITIQWGKESGSGDTLSFLSLSSPVLLLTVLSLLAPEHEAEVPLHHRANVLLPRADDKAMKKRKKKNLKMYWYE